MEVGKTTESIFPRKRTCPIGRSPDGFLSMWKTSEDLLPVHLILYERHGVVKNTLTFLLAIWKVLMLFYLLYHSKLLFSYLCHPPYCPGLHRYELISKAHKILPAQVHSVIWHFFASDVSLFSRISSCHHIHPNTTRAFAPYAKDVYIDEILELNLSAGFFFFWFPICEENALLSILKKNSIMVMLMFVCLATKTSTATMTMMKMKMIVMLVMTIRRPLSSICPYTSSCFAKHTHRLIQCLIP